ncbi:MAG: hypothetical protein Q9202_006375 [Teloschistes flavicans]
MFRLLSALEKGPSTIVWVWVFGIGVSMFFNSLLESQLQWYGWSRLAIPVRSLLSILIFTKSARRRNIAFGHFGKEMESSEPVPNLSSASDDAFKSSDGEAAMAPQDAISDNNPRHTPGEITSNLIGVDVQRISELTSFFWFLPASAIRLVVSIVFLYQLIGWESLLAGVLAWSITVPVNMLVSRRYSLLQHDLMESRDRKLGTITETLKSIRQIKSSALESRFQSRIKAERVDELAIQWRIYLYQTTLFGLLISGPVLLSTASLLVYVYLNGNIRPSIAFTTIAVLSQMEFTLAIIPEMLTQAMDGWISVRRVEEYLDSFEKETSSFECQNVVFEHASVTWPSDADEGKDLKDGFQLRELNLEFPSRQLSVISGPTGSGKSLLLAAILGEAKVICGTFKAPQNKSASVHLKGYTRQSQWIDESAKAFVAQNPWIDDGTIQANILFGLPYKQYRYSETLAACALDSDMHALPDGDLTLVGTNGVNLSGGQRWRVGLARALYSRAGILILDDILSSVDTAVAQRLFDRALTGKLSSGRTIILATHHSDLCEPRAAYIVRLRNGEVEYAGLNENMDSHPKTEAGNDQALVYRTLSGRSRRGNINGEACAEDRADPQSKVRSKKDDVGNGKSSKRFIEEEERGKGSLKWNLQWTQSADSTRNVLHIQMTEIFSSNDMIFHVTSRAIGFHQQIYILLSFLTILIGMVKYIWVFIACIKASDVMFNRAIDRVLVARLRWLDTVPVGRILNRFTADFSVLDSHIAKTIAELLYTLFELVGITIAGAIVSPMTILFAIVAMCVATTVGTRYLAGAREVKRLESITRSPILELLERVQVGIATIRAFDRVEHYTTLMQSTIDRNTTALMHIWLFNQWMSFRLNMLATAVAVFLSSAIVLSKATNTSLAGFALAFALRYNDAIIWVIRYYAILEMDMNSVERIDEYSNIPTEDQGGADCPTDWPSEGRIEVRNLVASYAEDLPPVLKGISFTAEKQRVGIVGRTGAGKSSLMMTLLRLLEAREGSILIDGVDIAHVRLQTLRSRLAIIPQDPVLFSGTLRANLDPEGRYTDEELYQALDKVNLLSGRHVGEEASEANSAPSDGNGESSVPTKSKANTRQDRSSGFFDSLSSPVSPGGQNLSQGQRQLLCLARTMICRPKILIMDEPTSAVDQATDTIVQSAILTAFKESTVLVIAHRLSTIVDFDKIVVLDDGMVVECGSPRKLLGLGGVFAGMVERSEEKGRLRAVIENSVPGSV